MDTWAPVIARALIASLFIVSGVRQARAYAKIRADLRRLGVPAPGFALGAGIAVELIAGIGFLAGYRVAWAALALGLFTAASTLIYYRDLRDRESFVHVLKNLAIIGGLVLAALQDIGPP